MGVPKTMTSSDDRKQPKPLIWKVTDGPYEDEYSGFNYLVCMVTDKNDKSGYFEYHEIFFETFDEAYWFKAEVDRSMTPLEV